MLRRPMPISFPPAKKIAATNTIKIRVIIRQGDQNHKRASSNTTKKKKIHAHLGISPISTYLQIEENLPVFNASWQIFICQTSFFFKLISYELVKSQSLVQALIVLPILGKAAVLDLPSPLQYLYTNESLIYSTHELQIFIQIKFDRSFALIVFLLQKYFKINRRIKLVLIKKYRLQAIKANKFKKKHPRRLFTIKMESDDEKINRIGNYTSQFRGDDLLGSGFFGSVYIGHEINNRKNKVAIKLISLKESSQSQIFNEVLCMLNLRSQGTLEILASQKIKFGAKKQQYYAIVTEKMSGSLRDLLEQREKLTEMQATKWGRKIIQCYKYLYKAKVMHRDLKPDNVLYRNFGDQIVFKIGDFGFSRSSNSSKLSNKGTAFYVSPQQENQAKYSNKTDVYAFGCILFEFLVGPKKLFSEVIKVIGINNGSVNKREAVKVARKVLIDIGVSEIMIQLIEGCLMYEESDRLAWKDIFDHRIFQQAIRLEPNRIGQLNSEREIVPEKKLEIVSEKKLEIKDIKIEEQKINKLRITPDTTTQAWKQNKYSQDNANKNVCIYQGDCSSDLLCSAQDLACYGESVFTIKVHKVHKYKNGSYHILIGVMDSMWKGGKREEIGNHCVYLFPPTQSIGRPNQEQTKIEDIKCSCESTLPKLPCLIECHVNRKLNTIGWHYNGKEQAKSIMPNSWKDGRKICALLRMFNTNDIVEFM